MKLYLFNILTCYPKSVKLYFWNDVSFMTNHRVCNKSNTAGVISGAGTAYTCLTFCRFSFGHLKLLITPSVSSKFFVKLIV
jgi:hypothetical protein